MLLAVRLWAYVWLLQFENDPENSVFIWFLSCFSLFENQQSSDWPRHPQTTKSNPEVSTCWLIMLASYKVFDGTRRASGVVFAVISAVCRITFLGLKCGDVGEKNKNSHSSLQNAPHPTLNSRWCHGESPEFPRQSSPVSAQRLAERAALLHDKWAPSARRCRRGNPPQAALMPSQHSSPWWIPLPGERKELQPPPHTHTEVFICKLEEPINLEMLWWKRC